LIIAGVVIFLVALAVQRDGIKLGNFSINIGSKNRQSFRVGNVVPGVAPSNKRDWVGLAITALGFLTAVIGVVRGLNG